MKTASSGHPIGSRRKAKAGISYFLICCCWGVAVLGSQAHGAPFADVSGRIGHLANALGKRNVLPPVWGAVLAPGAPVYRYEMAWMLAALLDSRDHPFNVTAWPDVPPGYWALQAVNQVAGVGIMIEEQGKFNGDRRVRREEFVVAVDRVLSYRAIPPPPPRMGLIHFPDVHGPNAGSIARAANFWQLMDPAPRFRPSDVLTREEAVELLAKAAPLVDRTFIGPLAMPSPPPSPGPIPTTRSQQNVESSTGRPTSPLPTTTETPLPPSDQTTIVPGANPVGHATWPPLAGHWALIPAAVAIGFSDSIVQRPALIPLGGADGDLEAWSGPMGLAARVSARVFPGDVGGRTDYFYQVNGLAEGLWRLGIPDVDLAIGPAAIFSHQSRTTVAVSVADRLFVGGGPTARLWLPLGALTGGLGAQLLIGAAIPMQRTASVTAGFGFGLNADLRYPLPFLPLEVVGGIRGQGISASGRQDILGGGYLGGGGTF